MEYARPEILVEPAWLAEHLDDPSVRVIDCGVFEGYNKAHIPGAVGLAVHRYIKQDPPPGVDIGTLIMPPDQFAAMMTGFGIGPGTTVVCYDDANGYTSARMWWCLRYYGHENARFLNGGWHGWITGGRPVSCEIPDTSPARPPFVARPNAEIHASLEYLRDNFASPTCRVLDARTDDEWTGANDRGNRRRGHVPGATHLEWLKFVSKDQPGRLLPADQLQAVLDRAGIGRDRPVVTYCQGGVRAAHAFLVLHLMGYDNLRVYDGSMREWANREDTPLTLN